MTNSPYYPYCWCWPQRLLHSRRRFVFFLFPSVLVKCLFKCRRSYSVRIVTIRWLKGPSPEDGPFPAHRHSISFFFFGWANAAIQTCPLNPIKLFFVPNAEKGSRFASHTATHIFTLDFIWPGLFLCVVPGPVLSTLTDPTMQSSHNDIVAKRILSASTICVVYLTTHT